MSAGRLAVTCAALALAACAPPEGDLRKELATLGGDLRGKVAPLPALKPYEPVPFAARELPDPFHPWLAVRKSDGAARQDAALLARYSSVEEIERARANTLADADRAIAGIENRMAQIRGQLADFKREREASKARKVPRKLQDAISATQAELDAQERAAAARKKERAVVESWFDADRKRYLEIASKGR